MNKIKIALCQMNVVDNKEENIKKAIEMISKIAKEENIYVLAGSIPELVINDKEKEGSLSDSKNNKDSLYNTSVFFNNNGEIIGKHRKVHLFDIDVKDKISFKESDTLSPGNEITVIETPFATIGIGICYDIRFVELSRIMALKGAELLIFPGAFNMTTGPAHWQLLFRSRALDNQVFAIGVAPALDKSANYNSYGHSIAINPWGELIEELDYEEELKVIEIDLDEIKKVREEIPVLKNRRSDLYEINEK